MQNIAKHGWSAIRKQPESITTSSQEELFATNRHPNKVWPSVDDHGAGTGLQRGTRSIDEISVELGVFFFFF